MRRTEQANILDFVIKQRAHVLSFREWKHRLAGFGFSIDKTEAGHMITTLPARRRVCKLPEQFCM
ncbi:hypothetical protein [Aliiroseovarius sp.]|uniref:hypothetical protein n=1 Tax=Aliiroseovarius sp. TaxID=1872442 RepID=UPI003BAB4CC8